MTDPVLMIMCAECKHACEGELDLEQRFRKSMAVVANGHWLYPSNEDTRFRAAVAGVLICKATTPEEIERIRHTLDQLRTLGAIMEGVPVDMDVALKRSGSMEILPLLKWWRDAKKS